MNEYDKGNFIINFLTNQGIDMFAILQAICDEQLEESYEIIKRNPNMTKEEALEKLNLEEYIPNPLPPKERTYTDKDFETKE